MTLLTFEDIQKAQNLLKGVSVETPILYSPALSKVCNAQVFLKCENFQETGSFKSRGAYVKLKSLSEEALRRGVIAMSAGNHAQAVAFHAQALNIPATIVMPLFTPPTKVGNTEKWGARVILAGQTLDEAQKVARDLAVKEHLTFIHPYDDPDVIAGQGTLGLEILQESSDLDVLLVPLGGGGLCAGVALAVKSLNPSLQIYGVEVEGYASMAYALYGRKESIKGGVTLADGIAVKSPGKLTQEILKPLLDGILIVSEGHVEQAVDLFIRKQKLIVEGAGAVGLAALLNPSSAFTQKKVGLIVTGGNIDSRLISAIMMRGQIREGRLAMLRIKINDVPGVLEQIARVITRQQGNILEVKHQRLLYEIPIKMAELHITVQTRGKEYMDEIVKDLEALGFAVDQVAGIHARNGLAG